MLANGKRFCDFVVFTNAGLHIDNIPFDQQFCDELVESCDSFFYQYLPEIVSHRILKTKASNHPKVAPLSNVGEDNELMELIDAGQHNPRIMTVTGQTCICICGDPEYGKMLQCRNIDCEIGSYHHGCVEICRKPKGKWVCRDCLEQ